MRKIIGGLMGLATIAAVAPAAQAVTALKPNTFQVAQSYLGDPNFYVTGGNPFDAKSPLTAQFGDTFSTGKVVSSFDDTFLFSVAGSGLGSGTVTSSSSSKGNNLSFTDVLINGVSIKTLMNDPGVSVQIGSNGKSDTIEGFSITSDKINSIEVQGTTVGLASYTGQATFTPSVPELATWGMMILGFGVVGAAMRRQRSSAAGYQKGSTNVSFA